MLQSIEEGSADVWATYLQSIINEVIISPSPLCWCNILVHSTYVHT